MANFEVLSLDGLTLSGDPTTALSIESFDAPPPKAKFEWVTAADSEWAALTRAPMFENREITLRVRVSQQATMDQALDQIGQLRDKLRRASLTGDGVAMTWAPATSARTVTFDVLAGEITGLPVTPSGDDAGWFQRRPVVPVTLTAKPYWRGTEFLTSTASTSTPIQTLDVTGVIGDMPALGRLIVTDTATQNRRYVAWGLESQYYNNATSLYVDSDSLVTSGFAGAQATRTGAHDPNATGNNVVRLSVVTPAPIAVCGTGNLSHVGTFRVLARGFFASEFQRLRLVWRDGDGSQNANPWTAPTVTGASSFWSEIDLGLITVNPATLGTQKWEGRIEAYDAGVPAGLAALDVDYLLLIPAAEGYGKATALFQYIAGTTVAREDFNSAVGASVLNARVAPSGGTWATSGATTDFAAITTSTSGMVMTRTTTSDAAGGRYAILGSTNFTDIEVGVQVVRGPESWAGANNSLFSAAIARWTNSSNFIRARLNWAGSPVLNPFSSFTIEKVVAGTTVTLASATVSVLGGVYHTIRIVVFASGRVLAFLVNSSGTTLAQLEAMHTDLATGGTLATGLIGFEDQQTDNESVTRWYDNFYASTPAPESIVLYSGRTLQVRSDSTLRQDSTGTYYGDVRPYRGSRFTIPPGTSRVAVVTRRQNIETTTADNVTDTTQIQVAVTPRGVVVPR